MDSNVKTINKKYTDSELCNKSVRYRMDLLKYIKKAGAGHTGGDLSCVDIINVLYNDVMNVSPDNFNDRYRDRYIQSKGHAVEILYVVLAERGFFPQNHLETIGKYRSPYIGHPTRKVNGIEFNTGALGHGLAISSGIALAGKRDKAPYHVFTLIGDGELAEGSNWEAAMLAAHYKLDNLIAILDHNTLQITDKTSEVCSPYPIDEKWKAFGWNVIRTDGHNIPELRKAFSKALNVKGTPVLVIADTIKGKGVSFMENAKKWHHRVPSDEEYLLAVRELEAALI
ncbi:MAG TPA: transketolase [Bacteroidales bacterium]|nr:transketolase [Bacteroidales bacterium]HPR11973.1 transketolase [Bacteroidales bacterium]HRW86430.1 transketolase [Bacteroidales bacterium]